MIQQYTFRQQLGNRGAFCSISFDIIEDLSLSSGRTFIYEADAQWKTVCRAGVLIFFDYYTRQRNGSLTIKIIEIKWLPVDTNNLIVLYSVVKGLCELMNVSIESLRLDTSTELFCFPEHRTS